MSLRPDLVDCWIFRVGPPGQAGGSPESKPVVEVLLIRRAPGRILPGLWQCVSGSIEPGERVALAALREVEEETGFGPTAIEAFYDLDLVNAFHEPSADAVILSAIFAVRVRNDVEPVLSHEHTAFRWVELQAAWDEVIWPGYRHALDRVRDQLQDSGREVWFRLTLDGARLADADQPGGPEAG